MDFVDQVLQETTSSSTMEGIFAQGTQLVSPGDIVTADSSYMRGHGTHLDEQGRLRASVSGYVEKLNRLVLVKPLISIRRYGGDVGDVVVGRVTHIGNKRWLVDINARQDAVLGLSSIPLPGGMQRRKSEQDELMMREFFSEGQILVAEVQATFADGALGLHTRNNRKYGKLLAGEMMSVPSGLVRRSKSHFLQFEWGVEVILGLNGYIWIGKQRISTATSSMRLNEAAQWEEDLKELYDNNVPPTSPVERQTIARTRSIIYLLERNLCPLDEHSIRKAYAHVTTNPKTRHLSPFDLLKAEHTSTLGAIIQQ
jgi:exosome complex component RRP4